MFKKVHDSQLLLSAKIGDGSYITQTNFEEFNTYYISFTSINLDYLIHKKVELEKLGVMTRSIKEQQSGYKKGNIVYVFSTPNHPFISRIGNMTKLEVICKLNTVGLSYYFLDDGTFHQRKHFGHLYCNSFNEQEINALKDVMLKYYPQKECSIRWDKKNDGREYPYLYIPVLTMNEFKKDIEKLLISNDIQSLMYKVGETK